MGGLANTATVMDHEGVGMWLVFAHPCWEMGRASEGSGVLIERSIEPRGLHADASLIHGYLVLAVLE